MKRIWFVLSFVLLIPVALIAQRWQPSGPVPAPPPFVKKQAEAAPLCAWRQPGHDLKLWYPQATGERLDTSIVEDRLFELKDRLGRWPTPDENPLYLHRVMQGQKLLGTVLVRRVKGQYGAIEIVLAVNPDGKVQGFRLQRLREPAPIADALNNPAWLVSFNGKTLADHWQLGGAVPNVAPPARPSAAAVVEGVRSLLILLAMAGDK